jgi:hypothetical protein
MPDDLEIALFASTDNDCIVGVYVRSLLEDELVEAQMLSLASVFLEILEPKEYEAMLLSAVSAADEETSKSGTASGEAWNLTYNRSIINIMRVNRNKYSPQEFKDFLRSTV